MKTTIYFFQYDTQNGMGVDLFTSEAELAERIHETVETYDPGIAAEMRLHPFGSDEWGEAWSRFTDEQGDRSNYFNHGVQEIAVAAPPEVREALETSARLIREARPRFPKSVRHPDRFQMELACAAVGTALSKL